MTQLQQWFQILLRFGKVLMTGWYVLVGLTMVALIIAGGITWVRRQSGEGKLGMGDQRLGIGDQRLEIGDWRLGIGRLETGDWRLEIGDWGGETRDGENGGLF